MDLTARLLVDAQARLGECAIWCGRTGSLWWTDIEGRALSRWHSADGTVQRWTLPRRVGSFALCAKGPHLLLGLEDGIALFDPASERLTDFRPLALPEQRGIRVNDGRCDRQGRFVFGLFNPAEAPVGAFYRVHADLRVEQLALPLVGVANSIAFSPDGRTMYFTDSPTRTIWSVDYGPDGSIGTPRVFVRVPEGDGFPDGASVDADGGLWSAHWDGGCVVRYDAKGQESARIPLPASRPTCPAFGGPLLQELYVSTARIGLDEARLAREPQAGGVFACNSGWTGLPESRFALAR
jgi:L-arabinonolactonase